MWQNYNVLTSYSILPVDPWVLLFLWFPEDQGPQLDLANRMDLEHLPDPEEGDKKEWDSKREPRICREMNQS